MYEYILNVNILSNIQYNQMSLPDWTNIYYWNDNNSYHLFTRSKLTAIACHLYIQLPVDLVPLTANVTWWGVLDTIHKRQGIVKGQSRMGIPETQTTLVIRHRTKINKKKKQNKTKQRKHRWWVTRTHKKRGWIRCSQRKSKFYCVVSDFQKISGYLQISPSIKLTATKYFQ